MEISKVTSANQWTYFSKGAANILFRYTGCNDYLRHKLLRLRLLKDDDQYISTCELYDFIELKCKHLFHKLLIDVQLVVLTSDFVDHLDSLGNKLMVKERYGLLLPNILEGSYAREALGKNCSLYYEYTNNQINSVILELKPKWLYDNKFDNYCRTCALNQLRGHKRHFCPLDLLYADTWDRGVDDLLRPIAPSLYEQIERSIPLKPLLRHFLAKEDNVFQKLKQYQQINKKNDLIQNITCAKDVSSDLSLVMTLRDVGLFLKFERQLKDNLSRRSNCDTVTIDQKRYLLTCNIYDLDLKSRSKYKHWLDTEQKLQPIYNSTNSEWRHCVKHQ